MAKEIQITHVHPLPERGTSFTWVPYWVFDVIVKARVEGKNWRDLSGEKYQDWLDLLKEALEEYGDVDFIESRNGYVHKLSDYTIDTPITITAKTAPAFKVGDADKAGTDLFTVTPAGTPITLTVDDSGNATIVSGKVHAVKAGDVTVTGKAGTKTSTIKLTITASA